MLWEADSLINLRFPFYLFGHLIIHSSDTDKKGKIIKKKTQLSEREKLENEDFDRK